MRSPDWASQGQSIYEQGRWLEFMTINLGDHYSTASAATGWHTQQNDRENYSGRFSVPSGRCARGTVIEAQGSANSIFVQRAKTLSLVCG